MPSTNNVKLDIFGFVKRGHGEQRVEIESFAKHHNTPARLRVSEH